MAKEDGHLGSQKDSLRNFKCLLASLGMHPITSDFGLVYPSNYLPVMLDGILLGYLDNKLAD